MARTMDDVALLFRTLSGQDALDPVSPPLVLREPGPVELRANTIGFFEDDSLVPVTPETRAAVNAAAAALRDAGFRGGCGGSSLCSAERCCMLRRFAAKSIG